jgi:cysteine-rich repeat protein
MGGAMGGAGGMGGTVATTGGSGGMPPMPVCGNGMLEAGEACDDNNALPFDGCDQNCAVEAGWICVGEPSVCETILNGCDSASATDMTAMSNVDIMIPAPGGMLNSCIRITTGNTVTFKMGTGSQHYLVSGTWTAPASKKFASVGPPTNENTIHCCNTMPTDVNNLGPFDGACCASPFTCCTTSEIFTLPKGANPWFDDKGQQSKIRGVIYVED